MSAWAIPVGIPWRANSSSSTTRAVYAQVRTHGLHAHLTAHLPAPPAEIVDVGGGAGHQSIPLARAGYLVTIVDPSSVMLAQAARLLDAESRDVAASSTHPIRWRAGTRAPRRRTVRRCPVPRRALVPRRAGPAGRRALSVGSRRYGVEPVAWYGVRLFTEGERRALASVDQNADVLAVELEASRRDPYRQPSRLFHLVGRRR
jgi:S-adenosylmethionine-dependent methyltransferase